MVTCSGEITLELNPGTIDKAKLLSYKKAGVNRLSIGLQAKQDFILKEIGRIHTFKDFEKAYKMAREEAGFTNINVDLMFGLPYQSMQDVKESVQYLISLEPEHISCYSLILHNKIFEHLPSEIQEREMYHWTVKALKEAGYTHYEISNFAKKSKESQHNLCYWNQEEYYGVGAGASSYIQNQRYTNELSIDKYIEKIALEKPVYQIEENQTQDEKLREYIILRLRLLEGVQASKVKEKFQVDFFSLFSKEVQKLNSLGLIEIKKDRANMPIGICLSEKGLDFANVVWREFL